MLCGDHGNVEAVTGECVVWGLIDGFLLYLDQDIFDTISAKIFLRLPYDVLKEQRPERSGYATTRVQLRPSGLRSPCDLQQCLKLRPFIKQRCALGDYAMSVHPLSVRSCRALQSLVSF